MKFGLIAQNDELHKILDYFHQRKFALHIIELGVWDEEKWKLHKHEDLNYNSLISKS